MLDSMFPPTGNKQKWLPLMIDVKPEGPRERSASRNNSRQNEQPRLAPNARNDLRGQPDRSDGQERSKVTTDAVGFSGRLAQSEVRAGVA